MRGTIGRSAIVPDEVTTANMNAAVCRIRLKDPKQGAFVRDFLNCAVGRKQALRQGHKAVQGDLNLDAIAGFQIPLPPEQKRCELVAALNEGRAIRRAKLAEADALLALLDGYLLDLLGLAPPPADTRRSYAIHLGEVCTSRFDPDYFHPERVLTVRGMQQVAGRLRCTSLQEVVAFRRDQLATPGENYLSLAHVQSHTGELVAADDSAEGSCFAFQPDDVLFGRLRPYLNKVHRAEQAGCCSTEFHVMRVRKGCDLLPDYLATVLRSALILAQTRHMMTGNTHPRLTNDDVVNLVIPIPDSVTQDTIATEVRRRREQARRLRVEAETGWAQAKRRFEEQLLGPAT